MLCDVLSSENPLSKKKNKRAGLSAHPQFASDCAILMLGMQRIFHAAAVENSRNQTQNFSHRIKISSNLVQNCSWLRRADQRDCKHTHTHTQKFSHQRFNKQTTTAMTNIHTLTPNHCQCSAELQQSSENAIPCRNTVHNISDSTKSGSADDCLSAAQRLDCNPDLPPDPRILVALMMPASV
jgi:hypothetical protein